MPFATAALQRVLHLCYAEENVNVTILDHSGTPLRSEELWLWNQDRHELWTLKRLRAYWRDWMSAEDAEKEIASFAQLVTDKRTLCLLHPNRENDTQVLSVQQQYLLAQPLLHRKDVILSIADSEHSAPNDRNWYIWSDELQCHASLTATEEVALWHSRPLSEAFERNAKNITILRSALVATHAS